MLLKIRNFISQAGMVSTQQLTREFNVDLTALQPMLDLWVAKGILRKCQEQSNCQRSCFKCRVNAPEYYQYVA